MKQLQLKEIVGYLPYGLKLKLDIDNHFIELEKKPIGTCDGINNMFNTYFFLIKENDNAYPMINCKPILFPISSLTQFREDLGFVPMEYLDENYFANNLVSQCERIIEDARWIYHSYYSLIIKLYEWKIDIHNLIEKGLAIEVTKEFNPYK